MWQQPFRFLLHTCPGDVVDRAYDEYDVSDRLKESGWVLPAYTMAPNAKHIKLLRAVIRYVQCGSLGEAF
jgi:glutamate decarboxylase